MSVQPTYGKGTTVLNFDVNKYAVWNPQEMNDIGKIAYSVISQINANNPLAVFDKAPVDNGDTIEQVVIKLVESEASDPDGLRALTPDKRDKLATRYFKDFNEKQFRTTVRYDKLRMVGNTVENYEEIADGLVAELAPSDIQEKYEDTKGLFKYGATPDTTGATTFVNLGTIEAIDNVPNYKKVLTTLKNTIKGFMYNSTKYNTAGLKRKAYRDDIFVIMPYELKNEIDVETLAGLFNLDKAEINSRIIEIDEGVDTNGDYTVYVVDRNAILIVTQLYMMDDQKNASGKFWNYFLNVTRMYALSALFNGTFFKVATITPETPETPENNG